MKLKSGYLLRTIAGVSIVVPVAERVIEFKGMMTLNETGAFLWKQLLDERTEDELLKELLNEFEVSEDVALADIREFIHTLEENHILE